MLVTKHLFRMNGLLLIIVTLSLTTTSAFTDTPYRFSETNLFKEENLCGLNAEDEDRIVGGKITNLYEFPWLALLHYTYANGTSAGFQCSGTLINRRYVLTAAHCVRLETSGFFLNGVRLGEWKISSPNDCVEDGNSSYCADPVVNRKIENVFYHAYHDWRNGDNDIAIIRLDKNVTYSDYIRPVCLSPPFLHIPEPGTIMTAVGWGITENGTSSDVKLKIDLPLVSNPDCANRLFPTSARISPNQICAGVNGRDSCFGDSGGPLMRSIEDKKLGIRRWYQEGIISRGRGCGIGYPAIHTRIIRYSNWIIINMYD